MSNFDTRRHERGGTDAQRRRSDPRPRHIVLGTDGDGRIHHYLSHTETIYVVDGADIVHREDVTHRHVDEWMAFVDDRVAGGWSEQLYGAFWERVADAVQGGSA